MLSLTIKIEKKYCNELLRPLNGLEKVGFEPAMTLGYTKLLSKKEMSVKKRSSEDTIYSNCLGSALK